MNPEEEIEDLEEIMDQILQGIMETLASGETLSDDLQGMIAQEIQITLNRIDELRTQVEEQRRLDRTPESLERLGAPPSPDAQLLWMLSGQQEQAFISYLRDFPSPATRALLSNPAELSRTLEYLTRIMPPGQSVQVEDGIPHADLQSSNVWGVNYNPRNSKMRVRFQGGSVYEYDGIPKNIYRAFVHGNASAKTKGKNQYGEWWVGKNPSLGAALNQYIKAGGFPYRRIS